MKVCKVIFGLMMALVLISGSAVFAQEVEPYEAAEDGNRSVNPLTDEFIVRWTLNTQYHRPAVAYGDGYYMVVYENETAGSIHATVYNTSGEMQYHHTVADLSKRSSHPAVAYEASSGLFVVAFQYAFASDIDDIRVQAVCPLEGIIGNDTGLGMTNFNERKPSIACKHNGTCLVAYEHSENDRIRGRFLTVNDSGTSTLGTSRWLTDSINASNVRLAWGKNSYYLAYDRRIGFQNNIKGNGVYDYPVSDGFQYPYSSIEIAPNFARTTQAGVAYDPCSEKFVVTFLNYSESNYWELWAVVQNSFGGGGYSPFTINTTSDDLRSPAISFAGTTQCGPLHKLVVTYNNLERGIMAAEMRGNSSTTNPQYVVDQPHAQFLVSSNVDPRDCHLLAIARARLGAKLFIAWESSPNVVAGDIIRGRIVDVMEYRTLSVEKTGSGSGVVSSFYGIDCGAICQISLPYREWDVLSATAAPGSVFTEWEGDGVNTLGKRSVVMDSDKHVIAKFDLAYTLSVISIGQGTVKSKPAGIDCGATCSADFAHNTDVTLKTTPAAGWTFTGWSGDCEGTGTCQVTMSQARSVTAKFEEVPDGLEIYLPLIVR